MLQTKGKLSELPPKLSRNRMSTAHQYSATRNFGSFALLDGQLKNVRRTAVKFCGTVTKRKAEAYSVTIVFSSDSSSLRAVYSGNKCRQPLSGIADPKSAFAQSRENQMRRASLRKSDKTCLFVKIRLDQVGLCLSTARL